MKKTKPSATKPAPKTAPKKPAPVSAAKATAPTPKPVTPAPATVVVPKKAKTTTVSSRIREDAVLSLSKVSAETVPGCRAMFRYAWETLAKVKKPITLTDFIAMVSADPEYKRRSHQDPASHTRQLVARLRKWGLLVAVNPEAPRKVA